MKERQLQVKSNEKLDAQQEEFANPAKYALEVEIECPRCHDDMTLCSEFDSLYYFCQQCDFCIFTLKKN